ncbi:hypothetical protein N0V88_007095 [Collariella sp. IMI 366227]|nr:hypothetical protein N0V88_007095 [Collariella sp. IMI 366227]
MPSPHLKTPHGPEPVAHCSICMTTKLDIPLLHGKPPRAKEDAWEVCHDFPCGHIVGTACANRWVRDYLSKNPLTKVGPRCPICRTPIFLDNQRAAFARLEVSGEFWLKLWNARLEDNQMEGEEEEEENDEEMEDASDESGDSDDLAAPGASRALLRPAGVTLPSNFMDFDSDSD